MQSNIPLVDARDHLLDTLPVEDVTLLADTSEYRPFIRSAGVGSHRPSPASKPHRPQMSYLLHGVETGSMAVTWPDGKTMTVKQGAFIVPPGTAYETRTQQGGKLHYVHFTVDQNPAWRRIKPNFCFGLRRDADRHMLQPPPEVVWGVSIPRALPSLSNDRIIVQMPEIIEDWTSHDRLRTWRAQDRFAVLVRTIIGDILTSRTATSSLSIEARIARAETVAAQSLHLGFDVNHMARIAGYDRSYFSQLYRRMRGTSAKDFLAALRLREAQRLLHDRKLTIAEIARQLGYSCQLVLTRAFSRHTGKTPGKWRSDHTQP